jgi:hypothetical protein
MLKLTPHMRRHRGLAFAVAAATLLVPATAAAHAAAPSVDVIVRDSRIDVKGADDLGRGPVRLRLSGAALDGARTVAVVALRDGVTRADVDDAVDHGAGAALASAPGARASEHALSGLARLGRLVAGGRVSADEGHVTTIVAAAGEYAVLDVTAEDGGVAEFTVAAEHSGARVPRSDATIGLRDKGFYLPSVLPADGIVRISNQGDLVHQATAYRLKRSVTYREAVRAAQRGRDLGAYGTSTVLTGAISPAAVSRVDVSLRRGRYLVVSEYTPLRLGAVSDVDRGLVAATWVR